MQRQWLWSYFTGQRSSRLIPELSRPAAQEPRSRTASAIDPVQLEAIDAGVKDGQDAADAEAAKTFGSNGLFGSREELGANYIKRDVAADEGPVWKLGGRGLVWRMCRGWNQVVVYSLQQGGIALREVLLGRQPPRGYLSAPQELRRAGSQSGSDLEPAAVGPFTRRHQFRASSVPAPNPGAVYQTVPIAPTTAPPELPKP